MPKKKTEEPKAVEAEVKKPAKKKTAAKKAVAKKAPAKKDVVPVVTAKPKPVVKRSAAVEKHVVDLNVKAVTEGGVVMMRSADDNGGVSMEGASGKMKAVYDKATGAIIMVQDTE